MLGELWAQLRKEVKFDEYSELCSAKQMFAQLRTGLKGPGLKSPETFGTAGWLKWLKCCFTSTETEDLLGTGAQDVHLDFHTAPEFWLAQPEHVRFSLAIFSW